MGNDVYNMILRHKGKYAVSSIWIYKNKCTNKGLWFVSERIDYGMTYSIDQTHLFSRSIYQAKNHLYKICFVQAQKAPIENHIQELDISPRVMNILTFATRLKMEDNKIIDGCKRNVSTKFKDKRNLVSSNLRWIHSSIGCYMSLQQRMQREDNALIQGGVTVEYP